VEEKRNFFVLIDADACPVYRLAERIAKECAEEYLKRADINEGIRLFQRTEGAVLLDVRTETEYKSGHIPGSINIPLDRIMSASNIIKEKKTPVFSYCLRGSRSNRAVAALQKMGYTNVMNIGGIAAYRGETARG